MGLYKALDFAGGARYMPLVWNLIPKPLSEPDFFVQPWGHQEVATCADFALSASDPDSSQIHFFVSDPEALELLTRTSDRIHLFGAYNQVAVCQIRATGRVQPAEESKLHRFERSARKIVKSRRNHHGGLHRDDVVACHKLLNLGTLFCFQPDGYAYDSYDRG